MSLPTKPLPDQDRLRTLFTYNPDTGDLIWNIRPLSDFVSYRAQSAWNGHFALQRAGCAKQTRYGKRRVEVVVDYVCYFAHRIIWKMMTGDDPKCEIDHKDQNQLNNRWSNLREATSGQNKLNTRVKSNSTTGLKGVKPVGKRFCAFIRIGGDKQYLGTYDTPEEAHEVYMAVAKNLHGEFFRKD